MSAKVQLGTVIHGTLRDEDLLEAFADELRRISDDDRHQLANDALELVDIGEDNWDVYQHEIVADMVNDLMDALNEYAPVHTYFGAHPGDGSDFGFWPEDLEMIGCDLVQVDDETSVCVYHQVVISVSDHGNMTVSELRGSEIWSIV